MFQFTFSGFHNQTGSPLFTIDDGAQPPVILAAKDRSIIAATFTKFLLRNIGEYNSKSMYFIALCNTWVNVFRIILSQVFEADFP